MIHVLAKQWLWKILHEGGQREINELHLPVKQPVQLTLISEDVLHGFSTPDLHVTIDVPPGRYVSTTFQSEKPGRYRLICSRDCGKGCADMVGQVIVMERTDSQNWLTTYPAEGSLATHGRNLFLKLQCVRCHSGAANNRGPALEDLYGRPVKLAEERIVMADENYIRESILEPRAKVVEGWKPIMPSFKGKVSEEELLQLIAFIKSLKPGQTPVRVEEVSPPVGAPTVPEETQQRPSEKKPKA